MEEMEQTIENLTRQVEEDSQRCQCGRGRKDNPIDLRSSDEAMGSSDERMEVSDGGTRSSDDEGDVESLGEGTAVAIVSNDQPNVVQGGSQGATRGRGVGRG